MLSCWSSSIERCGSSEVEFIVSVNWESRSESFEFYPRMPVMSNEPHPDSLHVRPCVAWFATGRGDRTEDRATTR